MWPSRKSQIDPENKRRTSPRSGPYVPRARSHDRDHKWSHGFGWWAFFGLLAPARAAADSTPEVPNTKSHPGGNTPQEHDGDKMEALWNVSQLHWEASAGAARTTRDVSDLPRSGPGGNGIAGGISVDAYEKGSSTSFDLFSTRALTEADTASVTFSFASSQEARGTGFPSPASPIGMVPVVAARLGAEEAGRPVGGNTDLAEPGPQFTSGLGRRRRERWRRRCPLHAPRPTDADATASLTYSLADDDNGRFEIDAATGVVTLRPGGAMAQSSFTVQVSDGTSTVHADGPSVTMDREAAASHSFTVQVSDGTSTDTQTVTLSVTDVNEAAPVITSGVSATAAENVSAAVLYTATATDADATATLTYSLADDDNGRFEIDAATGAVTLVAGQTLDRETAASHSFTVQVSDGTNTDTQTVTLSVTDVNEAAPVITSGVSATAAENVGAAAVLYTATATDADATASLTYSLTDDDNGRFEIDAATGVVTLVAGQTLDRETAASHSFTVEVSDGTNTDTQTVTLSVTDVNEAAPVITSGAYRRLPPRTSAPPLSSTPRRRPMPTPRRASPTASPTTTTAASRSTPPPAS